MPRWLLFVSAVLVIAGLASPTAADDRSSCFNDRTPPDIAIEACGRMISSGAVKGSELASTYNWRGLAYRKKHDYDRAIVDYTEAIRLSGNALFYTNRGRAYDFKGDYDRAIADYGEAIRIDPKYAIAYNNRGVVHNRKGDYERAIADYNEVIRIEPTPLRHTNRGFAYYGKGDYERAIADYGEAIRLNGRFDEAYFHRGRAHESKGDFENALTDFRSAFALAPNDKYAGEAIRRMERKLASRAEPKPPVISNQPETRVALVIGNAAYANFGSLRNPENDAKAVETALKGIGFARVTLLLDLSRDKLLDALKTFAREAETADWALIYFAGHGLELGGVNYLVPVDAKLSSDRDASYEAVELQKVLDAVAAARKIGLVILDACRDNPFTKTMTRMMPSTRSIGRGMAQIEPEGATLVAYAAKHGQVAEDGRGKNSPFVTVLIKHLQVPGIEIGLFFRKVRDEVLAMTGRRQEPFIYGSLPSEAFYFRKP